MFTYIMHNKQHSYKKKNPYKLKVKLSNLYLNRQLQSSHLFGQLTTNAGPQEHTVTFTRLVTLVIPCYKFGVAGVCTHVRLYLSGAEHCLLSVFNQALFTEQVAIGTLRHLLERKLPVAAATLNQLAVLRGHSCRCRSEALKLLSSLLIKVGRKSTHNPEHRVNDSSGTKGT